MKRSSTSGYALALTGAGTAAPAFAQTSNWQVTAQALASAYGSGAGGYFNSSDQLYACNGTASNCSGPTLGPGAPPVIYTHSDTQTFASLTADASGSYPALNANPAGSASGTAYAYADLATGELHIADSGSVSGYAQTSHSASAGFQDTLHFTGLSSPTILNVHVHLDGTFLGYNQPNLSFSMSNGYNSYLYLYQDWYDPSSTVPACIGIADCSNIAGQPNNTSLTGSWTKLGEGDYVGQITFDPLHSDATLQMHIGAGNGGAGFDDFSHTAGITFDLPSGLSFTSASGVFLTRSDTPAVPEPATWATMIAGFALLGGAMRRRSLQFAAG